MAQKMLIVGGGILVDYSEMGGDKRKKGESWGAPRVLMFRID